MKIKGTIRPLKDKIFVSDMNFDAQITQGGLYVPSSDGKADGITPRWGKVYAIGPEQTEVKIGDWVLIEHGRWTRGVEVDLGNDTDLIVRMVDFDAVMLVSEDKPQEHVYRRVD